MSALGILVCVLALGSFAQDADKIKSLIDIIRKGPKIYRTPVAMQVFARANPYGGEPAAATGDDALNAIKQSIRAAISLGDMGALAKDAVPALIEMYPQAEDVTIITNAHYAQGMGGFDDWVQTDVLGARNKFILSSPFIEYQTLTKCEKWVEAQSATDIHDKRISGGRIMEATTDIIITLRINAAAYALAQIVGYDAGNSRDTWRQWYDRSRGASASLAPSAVAPVNQNAVGAFPQMTFTVGLRYQLILTTGDRVSGLVESFDDNWVTLHADDGGRYNYPKSVIKNIVPLTPVYTSPSPAYAPAQISPYSGIPYEALLDFSYSGKMVEVMMRNGTSLKGTLGVVDASILHINVDGAEMPVSRSLIARITLQEDPSLPKAMDKTQQVQPQSQPQQTETTTPAQPAPASSGSSPW